MARDFEDLRRELRSFVEERDWDKFHDPKDLAMSLSIEAGELLEIFQWRAPRAGEIAPEDRQRIAEELADVTMYAMLLADKAQIDLLDAIARKLADNARKYPAEKARGRAEKYDKL